MGNDVIKKAFRLLLVDLTRPLIMIISKRKQVEQLIISSLVKWRIYSMIFLLTWRPALPKKHIGKPKKPDVTKTPLPRYDLINLNDYGSMALQFSRGCPFDCEFCDIIKLFGRVPRTKSSEQMIAEFNLLYSLGWRGSLFVVDDNFIGNKRDAMRLLSELIKWQTERDYPFSLYTEASVNLVEIPDMLDTMSDAG